MSNPELFFCGERAPAPKPYHYRECGLNNVYLMNGFTVEEVDGDEYVSVENVDGLWKAIGLALVTERKTFSPAEIRFLRNQIGMTQAELAKNLRVDDQTVARWEKKQCKLPGPADFALRILFLLSEVAQPDGKEILSHWLEKLNQILDEDEPATDEIHFARNNCVWETQRVPEVAYA